MYKIGDKVVVKTREELIAEGYSNANIWEDIPEIACIFTSAMYKKYGGKLLTIQYRYLPYFKVVEDGGRYMWTEDMVKPCVTKVNNNFSFII